MGQTKRIEVPVFVTEAGASPSLTSVAIWFLVLVLSFLIFGLARPARRVVGSSRADNLHLIYWWLRMLYVCVALWPLLDILHRVIACIFLPLSVLQKHHMFPVTDGFFTSWVCYIRFVIQCRWHLRVDDNDDMCVDSQVSCMTFFFSDKNSFSVANETRLNDWECKIFHAVALAAIVLTLILSIFLGTVGISKFLSLGLTPAKTEYVEETTSGEEFDSESDDDLCWEDGEPDDSCINSAEALAEEKRWMSLEAEKRNSSSKQRQLSTADVLRRNCPLVLSVLYAGLYAYTGGLPLLMRYVYPASVVLLTLGAMIVDARSSLPKDYLYKRSGENAAPKKYGQNVYLFACQLAGLIWKECLLRVRHPCRTMVELLAPVLLVLAIVYIVTLSPAVWIKSFQYTHPLELPASCIVPNESFISDQWERDIEEVGKWRDVFHELNMTSFFIEYTLNLAKLQNITQVDISDTGADASWYSPWTEEEVAQTLLSNRYAASPFKVPTFDEYISMVDTARVAIGSKGMKHMMYTNPLIYFILHFGRMAFAVKDNSDKNLVIAAERLYEYLNVTTNSFSRITACRAHLFANVSDRCVFESVDEAMSQLASLQVGSCAFWAVVRLDRLSPSVPEFQYTIFINETVWNNAATMETFPQGLGKGYANFAYSGVLTLQYELNTYFVSLVHPPHGPQNLSLTPFVESICGNISTKYNATQGMFMQPASAEQQTIVAKAAGENPILSITPTAFTDLNAVYAPCMYEIGAFCYETPTDSLLKCLESASNESMMSDVCRDALEFIHNCFPKDGKCNGLTAYELLTQMPSELYKCVESHNSLCNSTKYLDDVNQTSSLLNCNHELKVVCHHKNDHRDAFHACSRSLSSETSLRTRLSEMCQVVLDSFIPCSDEFLSICPTKELGTNDSIPYTCLYTNSHLLSESCKSTRLLRDFLPKLYGYKAVREKTPASIHYCRQVHDIYKILSSSVVVQAFPTNGYTQRMFFLSGVEFTGLILSVAFYFPFAATVQSITQEHELWQHRYFLIIGTHPVAFFLSRLFIASLTSFVTSLFITSIMISCFDIQSTVIYSLLYMYSLSLSSFAAFVGILVPGERAGTLITPFIFLLCVAPSIVGDQPTKLSGISSILPPTVLAKTVNRYITASQSGYGDVSQQGFWILFGLTIMYGVLATFLEYIFIPNSPLKGLLWRGSTSMINSVDRFLRSKRRRATRYYETEQLGEVQSTAYDTQREVTITRGREACGLNHQYNIGGVSNVSTGKEWSQSQFETNYSYEEDPRINLNLSNGESVAPLLSSTGHENVSQNSSDTTTQVPRNWHAAVTIFNANCLLFNKNETLYIPSADFYQNRLNCIIGEGGSGKSLLLKVLMGLVVPQQGVVRINGRDLCFCDRSDFGICLERNVFWVDLTVTENIRLMQILKGRSVGVNESKNELEILISALQLTAVRYELAGRLAEGVARKLAIAMALAGGSRVLLLDEPTGSADLSSRAEIWHLLSQNAKGRCIIVSTSDIEEVSVFADHVTVLFRGRLTLAGTPDFIRQKLGGGWVVTVCRGMLTKIKDITDCVLSFAPSAILVSNIGREVAFRIPEEMANTILPTLLKQLQYARESSLITNISVSNSSLTEAFVRITRVLDVRTPRPCFDNADVEEEVNGDYTIMPRSNSNPVQGGIHLSCADSSSNEELLLHSKQKFRGGYWAILRYRILKTFLAPLHGIVLVFLPLVVIAIATSPVWYSMVSKRVSDAAVLGWQLSFEPSKSFYADFSGTASPYHEVAAYFEGKKLPGTSSYLSKVDNKMLPALDTATVTMNNFLNSKPSSPKMFNFGAFAMQGSIVKVENNTIHHAFFPWRTDIVLYNTSYPWSLPAYVELLGILRLWSACNDTNGIIHSSIGPLRKTQSDEEVSVTPPSASVEVMGTVLLILPFAFYGSRMVRSLVEERNSGFLHVLSSSSLFPVSFWVANFAFDVFSFFLLGITGILVYLSSGIVHNVTMGFFLTLCVFMFIFGCSTISLSYLVSRCFNNPFSAQAVVTSSIILTGFGCLIASSSVRFLPDNLVTIKAKQDNEVYSAGMRFFPLFTLGEYFMRYTASSGVYSDIDGVLNFITLIPLPLFLMLVVMYETLMEVELYLFFREKVWSVTERLRVKVEVALIRFWYPDNDITPTENEPLYRWEDPSGLLSFEDHSITEERQKGYTADGIYVENIWKRIHKVYSLQNITLCAEGEALAVVGINGSGKTTLLRCLAGAIFPSHGSVFLNGHCTTGTTPSKLEGRGFVGYAAQSLVLQNITLTPFLFLNIMADLRLLRNGAARKEHLNFLMRTLGIEPFEHEEISSLTISMQRRVALAAALVAYPPIVILDDVTASLDPLARRQMWAAIRSVPQGTAIVFSTRFPDDVEMLSDRVLFMDKGIMKFIGTPEVWRSKYKKGLHVMISVSTPYDGDWLHYRSYHSKEREDLYRFFTAHWDNSELVECHQFYYIFYIPLVRRDSTESHETTTNDSSHSEVMGTHEGPSREASNGLYDVLATFREWVESRSPLIDEREENEGERRYHPKFNITISETTMEHTVKMALKQGEAFQCVNERLYNQNVYIRPRDFSPTA